MDWVSATICEVAVSVGSNRMIEETEELLRRIKQRSVMFVIDNIQDPTPSDFIFVENAMMVGATIKGEVVMEFDQREGE
jgi:hypothetical protein